MNRYITEINTCININTVKKYLHNDNDCSDFFLRNICEMYIRRPRVLSHKNAVHHFHHVRLLSSGAVTASTSFRFLQFLYFDELWCADLFYHKLRDAITFVHLKWFVVVIEENDADITTVVVIHHTGPNIDEMFGSQSRSRSHASVGPTRQHHCDVGFGNSV